MFKKIVAPHDSYVLDLGCGPGYFWDENEGHIPATWQIVLADLSPGMLNTARDKFQARMDYVNLNAPALPFRHGQFDVILASFVVHHISKIDDLLIHIREVLSSGGRFYTLTSGEAHMREIRKWISDFDIKGGIWQGKNKFTVQNGFAQLASTFEVIEMEIYEDSLSVPEVEPIMRFVHSGLKKEEGQKYEDNLEQLQRFLTQKLDKDGAIKITKETGLFVAR